MEHERNQEPTVRMQARLSRSPGGFSAASVGSRDESEEEDEGPNVEDLRTIPIDVEARMQQRAVKRQAEKLTDEDDDEEWAGTISIGTPAQKFLIDFDSAFF